MKLNEWMEFNDSVINCGTYIIKVLKNGSFKTDDILFTTCANKDVCKKFFGNLEIPKNGVMVDKRPDSDYFSIRILLWEDK